MSSCLLLQRIVNCSVVVFKDYESPQPSYLFTNTKDDKYQMIIATLNNRYLGIIIIFSQICKMDVLSLLMILVELPALCVSMNNSKAANYRIIFHTVGT